MRDSTEHRDQGLATGFFLTVLALSIFCGGAWLLAAPAHRDFVARISVTVLFAYAWGMGLHSVRNATSPAVPSNSDLYQDRRHQASQFDPLFLRMREELTGSMRSQSYFLHILWPRLAALSHQYESPMPPAPRHGRLPWRGQSLDAIDQIIAQIESCAAKRP